MRILDMLLQRFRRESARSNGVKRISPDSIVSANAEILDMVARRGTRIRSISLRENIVRQAPLVRMFFRTGEGHEQTPIVTGHLVRAHVIKQDGMSDQFEVTIRVNADQAANLPFVEVYDA